MMKTYEDITIKYLKKHKSRTTLTILGIIISIAFFTAIATLYYSYIDINIQNIRAKGNYEIVFTNVEGSKVNSIIHNLKVFSGGIVKDYGEIAPNINLLGYDKGAFKHVFPIEIIEGRLPSNNNEIVISDSLNQRLSVGSRLEKESQKYEIVGIYQSNYWESRGKYMAITLIEEGNISEGPYHIYANLKGSKNKISIANNIAEKNSLIVNGQNSQAVYNEILLRFYGQSSDPIIDKALRNMFILIGTLIITCAIAGIYNIFAISVVERTRHFGILRAIGATHKQLRKIIYREGIIMALIGIPLGILVGHSSLYLILRIITALGFSGVARFGVGLYPQVILIGSVLGGATILFSLIGPSKITAKISPLDAIKNSHNIKKEKIKSRKSRIIRGIFGVEGEIGYKNIRRNPKEFWVTIFSLFIAIVLFVTLTNLVSMAEQADDADINSRSYHATFFSRDNTHIQRDFIKSIENLEGVKKVYYPIHKGMITAIESSLLKESYPVDRNLARPGVEIIDDNYSFVNMRLGGYDKNSLKEATKHLVKGRIDQEILNQNGVLLVLTGNHLAISVGDTIKLPKLSTKPLGNEPIQASINLSILSNEFDSFEVVGILKDDPFTFNDSYPITMILNESLYEQTMGSFKPHTIYVEFVNHQGRNDLFNDFLDLAREHNLFYMDYHREREGFYQGMIILYTVIAIVALLGIISIFNTMYINHLVKRREYAIYKAMGMTKIQFGKLVIFQGLLYGLIAAFFGSITGFFFAALIRSNIQATTDNPLTIPLKIIVVGILGVIGLNLIGSILPLKKLHEINISEAIRFEE